MGGDLRATPRTPDHLRGGAAGRAHRGRLARGRGLVPDEDTVALLATPGALGLLDDGQLGGLSLLGQALVVGQFLATHLTVPVVPLHHCSRGCSPPSFPAYSAGSSASDSSRLSLASSAARACFRYGSRCQYVISSHRIGML